MLFSVIIPTHNRADKLQKCLESLTIQTYKNFEVIVSDDGSTDHTKKIVESFQKTLNLRYLHQSIPSGRAARPRNLAAEVAQGEWLCFLDSDDSWYENKLEYMQEYLNQYDVIYHALDTYTEKGKKRFRPQWGRKLHTPVFVDLMTGHNALITSATMIRKKIFDDVQGFCEIDLEDYDLWLRVARITERFYFVPIVLGGYWAGGGNTTEVSDLEIKRLEAIFEKHKIFLETSDQNEARLALSFIKARVYHKMGDLEKAKKFYRESMQSKNLRIKSKAMLFNALSLLA